MLELEFSKLKMQDLIDSTQNSSSTIFYSDQSSVDFFFFPCSFGGCSFVLLLMFFSRSQTKFLLCFQILLASNVLPNSSLSTSSSVDLKPDSRSVSKFFVLPDSSLRTSINQVSKTRDATLQNPFNRLSTNYIVSPQHARLQISPTNKTLAPMCLGLFCQLLTSPKLPLIIFNATI